MPGEEPFATIAEVAIAFLGFTGVMGVFSRRVFPPAVSLRLWVMVEFGLGLLLLALLPFVLHHMGWEEPGLWAACSVGMLVFFGIHFGLVVPQVVRHVRSGEWETPSRLLNLAFRLTALVCLLTQVSNVLGVGLERELGGYLLGLFLLLAASGLNFISLLAALFSLPRDDPP